MKETLSLITTLLALPGFLLLTACSAEQEQAPPQDASIPLLIGTYTGSGSEGIYQAKFDPDNGTLSDLTLLVATDNPSFICLAPNAERVYAANRLYAVNENQPGSVSVFEWNEARSALSLISQSPSGGAHPCFIEASDDLLAFANYTSGDIGFYPLDETGNIAGELQMRQHSGSGPVMPNQQSAHAHCSRFGPAGTFVYAADLGIDQILAYPVREDGLGEQQIALQLEPGDGPRHLAFQPEQHRVFVINELSSTVVSATLDEETGTFTQIDRQSTLPEGFAGDNACADIHLSPDGQFLYASNRGHNSIAVFSVSDDGHLALVGTEPVQGDWPRNFTLSPDGAFLLVANQRSDNITVFRRDAESGLLSFTGQELKMSKPVCLVF